MAESEKKPEAPKENPAMGQIVGYLKDYPFLLITVAGLIILSGILIFDIEKLKEFKWLIYAVVLVPLAIQFLIEFKKMQPPRAIQGASPPVQASPDQPPLVAALPLSRKAWISLGISMLMFGVVAATPENELHDEDFAIGFLVFALVAAGFALAAMYDVNRRLADSKGAAITAIVLSTLLVLAPIGWMTEENGDIPAGPAPVDVAPMPAPQSAPKSMPQPLQPPAPVNLPPAPAKLQPALPSLEGRYQLLAYHVDGEPQAAAGSLAISRRASDRFQWQAHLVVQDFSGMQTFAYSGQFINHGGQWFIRISGSDDPDWVDTGEVPMRIAFDGRNATFSYFYDGDQIQSAWERSR
jgi:hypothetical protein